MVVRHDKFLRQNQLMLQVDVDENMEAANSLKKLMELGCFDKEFVYYSTAYQDGDRIAYKISAKEYELQKFVEQAAKENLWPISVHRYIKRTPCPSGQETKIREKVKYDAAKSLRNIYDENFFQAVTALSSIEANNLAYPLLKEWEDQLEGIYNRELITLYESLVLLALESKVLTMRSYLEIAEWLKDIYKQLDDDIIVKGRYKKVLSGFAYKKIGSDWAYLFNARTEVTYEERSKKELEGYIVTPVFVRELWLNTMSEFDKKRVAFKNDYKAYCENVYFSCFEKIKSIKSPIESAKFEEQLKKVETLCTDEAINAFKAYRFKWNIPN